jgi:hypothetical protein
MALSPEESVGLLAASAEAGAFVLLDHAEMIEELAGLIETGFTPDPSGLREFAAVVREQAEVERRAAEAWREVVWERSMGGDSQ